jgi:IMP dehydrogenase
MFEKLVAQHLDFAPVVKNKQLVGIMSRKSIIRSKMYQPALDKKQRLLVAAAIGVNGRPAARAKELLKAGVDILIIDTAHGHQQKMLDTLKTVKKVSGRTPIVAGNVVTADATRDLIAAGADIVKVGVGPGAACTTRMVTGVGRPQFSAVLECAQAARELGKHVWADGGTKYPRDFALALAAGASSVMVGSWFSKTYESPGDLHHDADGRMYKDNFGMASRRAVTNRNHAKGEMEKAFKEYFREGISDAKMFLDPKAPGVEDNIDQIIAGVRSAMSYAGAKDINEFYDKAVIGIQSASGFSEGQARSTSW